MELNRWPCCVKCAKPVDRFKVERKDEAMTLIVHAECHGKREGKEVGRITAELMMTPLEFFGE